MHNKLIDCRCYLTGLDSIYCIGGREVKKQWYWMSLSGAPYKQTFQNWLVIESYQTMGIANAMSMINPQMSFHKNSTAYLYFVY